MATTVKRISIALTKEDLRELGLLCEFFEDIQSNVIKRALTTLYALTLNQTKESK